MKTQIIILLATVMLTTGNLCAQQHRFNQGAYKKRHAEMAEKKLQFLKNNLHLSDEEKATFEKIYRAHMKKRQEIRKRFKGIRDKINEAKTEKEKKEIIKAKLKLDKERCNLNEQLILELEKTFSPDLVIEYFQLEKKFHRQLMKRLRHKEGKKKPQRPAPMNKE